MKASKSKNLPSAYPDSGDGASQVASIWQFAQYRINTMLASPAVRIETLLSLGLLFLLFAPALPGWWQRWTLSGSFQLYSVFLLLLIFVWIRVNRRRLAVPELDAVRASMQEVRSSIKLPGDRDEQDITVLHALSEDRPLPVKRPLWVLLIGCMFTAFAYWVREPILTYLAFALVVTGIVAYRYGTQMLRVALFPLIYLWMLLPAPGLVLDWINERVQNLLFGSVLHVLLNANIETELPLEGNPLRVNPKSPQAYELFAGQAGMGMPEFWFVLMFTLWFLSIIRVPYRNKIGAAIGCVAWMVILMVLRLLLLCWVGTIDREMTTLLEPLTRFLLILFGIGGQFLILRGFKCQKFQKWVSI